MGNGCPSAGPQHEGHRGTRKRLNSDTELEEPVGVSRRELTQTACQKKTLAPKMSIP